MLKNIIILLPFLVSLFWAIHFFINRKSNSRSQNIWMAVMGLVTITTTISAFYWYIDGNYSLFYKLDILETLTTLLFVPVVFLYFKELTGDKQKSKLKICVLFIPPVLFAGANAAVYITAGEELSTLFLKEIIENGGNLLTDIAPYKQIHTVVNDVSYCAILLMQIIIVLAYAFHRLIIYREHLNDFFSNIDGKDMERHWAVFGGLLVFLVLTFFAVGMGYLLFSVEYTAGVAIFLFLYAATIYYISYNVSQTHYTAENFVKETNGAANIQEETEIDGNSEESADDQTEHKNNIHLKFLPKFNQTINEDKLFLQKNLRIDDLAVAVGTNRVYISRILKDKFDCSFWEFINRKRIEYAKEQILQHPDLTQEELAHNSGFTHDTAFSRAFRQYEGITFREWRKGNA